MAVPQPVAIRKVVFLDRDGVINRDSVDYIKSWKEFEFLPGSLSAISRLSRAGFNVIIITNQSIINRGMVPLETLTDIFTRMSAAVTDAGGSILDIFFCPHTPDDRCDCRKPKTGLLLQARDKYTLNLGDAVMVGDSAKDIECAARAGCGYKILVRTGNGLAAEKELVRKGIAPDTIVRDLSEAADTIINSRPVPGAAP